MNSRIVRFLALACAFIVALLLLSEEVRAADKSKDRRRSEQLVVRNISPGQDITDHEWGIVKVEVGVEKRQVPDSRKKSKSRRSPLKLKVDNKEVSAYVMGSAAGYEGKKTYAYRTLGIRLGAQPGPRTITILYDGLVKSIPVNYSPSGQLEFANFYDDQALFGKRPVTVRWLGCYLLKESVKASINGEPVSPDMVVPSDTPEIVEGSVSPGEILRPGANTVKIEAVDIMGTKREKALTLHYYPDNRVPVGDAFVLNLGLEESKSGPFYDAVVEGGSLVKKREFTMPPRPERIGGQTVVPEGQAVLAWFEAIDKGEGVITTRQKQYSTDVPREIENTRVAVYAAPPPLKAIEVAGQSLVPYLAEKLFACVLPDTWQKVQDPDGGRKVYGVAAYETSQEDKSAMRASIEFYRADSQAGSLTAEEYVKGLLPEEQPKGEPAPLAQASNESTLSARLVTVMDKSAQVASTVKTWVVKKSQTLRDFLEGEQPGEAPAAARVLETTVAGRQSKTVEREVSVVTGRRLFLPKKILLAEKFVVIPADAGFYVIGFTAPAADAQKSRDLFEAIIDSFQPLR